MFRVLKKIVGEWRLLFDFCPECNSSPPDPTCFVCEGDYRYGKGYVDDEKRERWRKRMKTSLNGSGR